MRVEPHRHSSSDYIKKLCLQHKKDKTKFYKGDEGKILVIATRQIESQEMANRKKKGKKCYYFAQEHSLKSGLKKVGKKGKDRAHKEVKQLNDKTARKPVHPKDLTIDEKKKSNGKSNLPFRKERRNT